MTIGAGGTRFPDGHIDWIEAAAIIVAYTIAKAFLVFPERMVRDGITAGWTIPIFSALVSILWLYPLVLLLESHPGKNLVEITGLVAGRTAAILFGMIYGIYILGIGATVSREIASALNVVVLPLTPTTALMIIGLIVSLYIAYQGVEVLGRLCAIHAVGTIAVMVLLSLMSSRSWDARQFFPLLGPGAGRLGAAYIVRQSIYGEVLGLGIVGAYLRNPREETGKAARWSLGASAFALTLTALTVGMVFPYPALVRVAVPFLRISRYIFIGRFLQRLDALFVVVWLGVGVMKTAVGHYLGAVTLATTFNLKTYKPLIAPIAVVSFAAGRLIPDYSTAIILDFDILRTYGTILVAGWPISIYILSRFTRPEKEGGGQ